VEVAEVVVEEVVVPGLPLLRKKPNRKKRKRKKRWTWVVVWTCLVETRVAVGVVTISLCSSPCDTGLLASIELHRLLDDVA
jgi:hypothetical protein